MLEKETLLIVVQLAGVGQLLLFLGSFAIPKCLDWKPVNQLPNLLRQLFWTYAGYILVMHLFFGLLSTFGAQLLLDGTPQAAIFCGLMLCWWSVRIVLQFCYFDRKGIPQTRFNIISEVLLVALFFSLTTTYAMAFYSNLND